MNTAPICSIKDTNNFTVVNFKQKFDLSIVFNPFH